MDIQPLNIIFDIGVFVMIEEAARDSCEWCGHSSPRFKNESQDDYMELVGLFGRYTHVICLDCYNHMKKVK